MKAFAPLPWNIFNFFVVLTIVATVNDVINRSWNGPPPWISLQRGILKTVEVQKKENVNAKITCFRIKKISFTFLKRFYEAVLCFSVLSNVESVMCMTPDNHKLDFLHGLRAILSFSIIFCHYRMWSLTGAQGRTEIANVYDLSRISVSWFFIISAMLNCRAPPCGPALKNLSKLMADFHSLSYL